MGLFDTYGDRQMKMGEPWQRQFNVGDSVKDSHVDDGVYLDTSEPENRAIVIKDGIFIGEFSVFDYWGNKVTWKELF
mgnify:CR=1 FL=1